jgi:nucleoside-diphosphate-sugar epimerase
MVSKLTVERSNLLNIPRIQNWDIVYDQICYSSMDAQTAADVFKGKIGKLIMASTEAVYSDGYKMDESQFKPYQHELIMGTRNEFSYAEGKRNAEAYYFQNASFPVCAVRIPFVFGKDDYTNRLQDLIKAINDKKKLKNINPGARISVINSEGIGDIMAKLAHIDIVGGINIAPREPITMKRFLETIEVITKKQAIFALDNEQYFDSEFLLKQDRCLNSDLLSSFGIEANSIESWFKLLVGQIHHTNSI